MLATNEVDWKGTSVFSAPMRTVTSPASPAVASPSSRIRTTCSSRASRTGRTAVSHCAPNAVRLGTPATTTRADGSTARISRTVAITDAARGPSAGPRSSRKRLSESAASATVNPTRVSFSRVRSAARLCSSWPGSSTICCSTDPDDMMSTIRIRSVDKLTNSR